VRNALQALVLRGILGFHRSRLMMAERISGVGVAYPARSGADHAWAGRRMPDLDCDGTRLYEHLRDGRFLLVTREPLTLGTPGNVHSVHSSALGEQKTAGPKAGPKAVLVRPDGYVAWAADSVDTAAVSAAVAEWCGEAARQTEKA
jgi:hypothetical protein